jgi:hypothetical protein
MQCSLRDLPASTSSGRIHLPSNAVEGTEFQLPAVAPYLSHVIESALDLIRKLRLRLEVEDRVTK